MSTPTDHKLTSASIARDRKPKPIHASGVISGAAGRTIADLTLRITRKHKGMSKREAVTRLQAVAQELADARWSRATKGQRLPTGKQAVELCARFREALGHAQYRCKERLIDVDQALWSAMDADTSGNGSRNGGTCGHSYGYEWSTTTATARRQSDGSIKVCIHRSLTATVSASARHICALRANGLLSGEMIAVQHDGYRQHYLADGSKGCVSIEMPADLIARFSVREHGATVEICHQEIIRKRAILAAEAQAKAQTKRAERRERLFARLSCAQVVTSEIVRSTGACIAGIESWCAAHGKSTSDSISLRELSATEPMWAIKSARVILAHAAQKTT